MPRPFGTPNDRVDVVALARAGERVERVFSAAELPRLSEAGCAADSSVTVAFTCGAFEERVTLQGELGGELVLTCQRCMQPVAVPLQERFDLVVVRDETEAAEEVVGYEPVVADPSRADLKWLTEEQALLALPLVPMHEPGECAQGVAQSEPSQAQEGQKPFGNLRELLGKR